MIDWEKTQAYCLEALAFPSEIWVNLEGRTPCGRVKPGAEYEKLIGFLGDQFSNLMDPETGRRLIRRVYRREEIYNGPYLDLAPDLVFSWWDQSGLESRKSVPGANHPSLRDNVAADGSPSAAWSGTHRLHGILLMKGGPFRRGEVLSSADITDIAPTLLHLLGLPVPTTMDGRVLTEAFEAEFAMAAPVQYRQGIQLLDQGGHAEAAYTAEESETIQERLKGLGYID
jgi:predicted AlkP superfamily phosphohydrolase/phosphomutase